MLGHTHKKINLSKKGENKMSKSTFVKIIKEKFPLLAQYTPILARVHGENHPELERVRDIFAKMNSQVQDNEESAIDLSPEFNELRRITGNYSVPADGCETYQAVYQMLDLADKTYHDS